MMRAYLFDTNAASALFDTQDVDHPQALTFLNNAASAGDLVYVSRVVIAEIEYGYKLYASIDAVRRSKADAALRAFRSVREIGKGTTEHYASIRAALFTKFAPRTSKDRIKNVRPERLTDKTTGRELGIQENDLWMAAIAVQYNMSFVSDDKMRRIKEAWPTLDLIPWK